MIPLIRSFQHLMDVTSRWYLLSCHGKCKLLCLYLWKIDGLIAKNMQFVNQKKRQFSDCFYMYIYILVLIENPF